MLWTVVTRRSSTCVIRYGTQPGKFRLTPGKCGVGALACISTPRQEKKKEGEGEKYAKIVDSIQNKVGSGRIRNRVRHLHRSCNTRELKATDDICIGTWNARGASWALLEERHVVKFKILADYMREADFDIICLTDLHGTRDDRAGTDTRFETCMYEEFLIVMMIPAVYKCWDGQTKCWDEEGRIVTIDLTVQGCSVNIGSVYKTSLPDTEGRGRVCRHVEEMYRLTPADTCLILGGDWNSHIGRDGVQGRQALLKPSSAGSKQMTMWLENEMNNNMIIADHTIHLKRRATWCNCRGGEWLELDYWRRFAIPPHLSTWSLLLEH